MTKHEHSSAAGVTDETFDLMDWIASGTVARRQVTIYNDPALGERLRALDARLREVEAEAEKRGGDAALDATDDRQEIIAEIERLFPEWEQSKAVWTVRALSEEDVDAAFDAVPAPQQPVPPLEKAGQKAHERYMRDVNAWHRANTDADKERQLHLVAAAVESVETPNGTAHGATVEQLRALRSRPHGAHWFNLLYEAVSAATEADTDVPRPTSPALSTRSRA